MKTALFNQDGKQSGQVELSDSLFGRPWNPLLVHQVLVSYQANERGGLAHTKTRDEVAGSGKKPWQQKGTGRARHGSRRSPIWVGGGVTFGPRNTTDWSQKINRKVKFAALASILSKKLETHKILPLETISLASSKTKELLTILTNLQKVEGFETLTHNNPVNVLVIVPELTAELKQAAHNLTFVTMESAKRVNPLQVAKARYIVIVDPQNVSEVIEKRVVIDRTPRVLRSE